VLTSPAQIFLASLLSFSHNTSSSSSDGYSKILNSYFKASLKHLLLNVEKTPVLESENNLPAVIG